MTRSLLVLTCGLIIGLAGCAKKTEDATTTTLPGGDQPPTSMEAPAPAAGTEPAGAAAKGKTQTTASGLQIEVLKEGTGATPKPGQVVSVHYIGTLKDGKQFDNSRERNEPIEFPLGEGRVIKGWDEGIALMKVGERAKLIIPGDLGYGPMGHPPDIPPDAELHFDVELMAIK